MLNATRCDFVTLNNGDTFIRNKGVQELTFMDFSMSKALLQWPGTKPVARTCFAFWFSLP